MERRFHAQRVNLKLSRNLAKNFVFAQPIVGTGEALMPLVIDDQKTTAIRVDGKRPLLVGPIVDPNQFSPQLQGIAPRRLAVIFLSRFHT